MGSREVFFRYGYLKPSGFDEAKKLVITGSGFDLLRNSPWLTICCYSFQGTHPQLSHATHLLRVVHIHRPEPWS